LITLACWGINFLDHIKVCVLWQREGVTLKNIDLKPYKELGHFEGTAVKGLCEDANAKVVQDGKYLSVGD
jgi:hypothetical protein